MSNLQSLATSQFSRQVPLQQFDFLPGWKHEVLLKQDIAQVPRRIVKINVKNAATKFLRLYIVRLFGNKTRFVKTSHICQGIAFLGYANVIIPAMFVTVLTNYMNWEQVALTTFLTIVNDQAARYCIFFHPRLI